MDFTTAVGLSALAILVFLQVVISKRTRSLAKANEELQNANQLWQIFANADAGFVFLKNDQFQYVLLNKALKDFIGLPSDRIVGHDDFAIVEPELAEVCTKMDRAALEQGKLITETFSWQDRFYTATKFPVPMPGGSNGVGAHITDTTEDHQRQRASERVFKHNKLVLEILSRSFDNTQEALDYALHELLKLTGSKYGYIYFYDEETRLFTLNSWTQDVMKDCVVEGEPKVYQLENTGIWGEVVRQRKPLIINDFQSANPLKKGYPTGHVDLYKYMSVPVIIDDKIVAVVGLANKDTDYNDTDVREMNILLGGVWNAVQRRETMRSLSYERYKYLQTLVSIGDGVVVIDADKKIEFLNPAASRLTGWSLDEAVGMRYREVLSFKAEESSKSDPDPVERVFITQKRQDSTADIALASKGGRLYSLENSVSPLTDDKGSFTGVVLVFRDVTEKRQRMEKIEYMSFHDPLTGLYNRRFFEEELQRLDVERNLPISVLMGDVNGLKLTNDVFGHYYGDIMLKKVANVLTRVCRADDIIARRGGDEFMMLLPKTDAVNAKVIADRIKKEVSKQQIRSVECNISVGIGTKAKTSQGIEQTLVDAETDMYAVKILEHSEVQQRKLNAIVDLFYSRNAGEKRHAIRVADMSARFGKVLGLSEADVRRLARAAHYHDIGKVVLKPSLLKRGYPSNTLEGHEMDRHPIVGYRILNYFDQTMGLADIVLAHHENWDGSGYPKGLKGEEIPHLAMILNVVGIYDRLLYGPANRRTTNNRSEALREIQQQAGIKFDPEIIEAFSGFLQNEGHLKSLDDY